MNTKLQAWSAGAIEGAILVAAWVVPLLVNFYGFRVFSPAKGGTLLALALLALFFAFVSVVEGGRFRPDLLRRPLIGAALILLISTLVSTLFSEQRFLSFVGTGERGIGFLHALATFSLFAAAAWAGRDAERLRRITAMLVAASVPVAIYAIVQRMGLQVIPGKAESASRAFGTLSNPIFMAAYMMMLALLALGHARRAIDEGRSLVFAGYGLVFGLQVFAILLSASRGPLLGLAAGLFVLVVATALKTGRKGLAWSAIGLAAAGLIFLIAFNLPGTPLAPLREVPVLGRFGEIAVDADSSSARIRIWRSAQRLIAAEPGRLVLGHGPETFKHALLPHGETYIAGRGQSDRLVDRGHNVLLDRVIMTGILGALAQLLVYGAWLFSAARLAGLVPSAADRRRLTVLLVAGTGLASIAWIVRAPIGGLSQAPALFAPALTLLGLVGGLGVYLLLALLRGLPGTTPGADATEAMDSENDAGSAEGLIFLAIGVAAVVEATFGIQTLVTEMVFWLLAGLVVARSLVADGTEFASEEDKGAPSTAARAASRRRSARNAEEEDDAAVVTIGLSRKGIGLGMAVGAGLSALIFGFYIFGTEPLQHTWLVLGLLILSGIAAGMLAASDARAGALSVLLSSLIVVLSYAAFRSLVLSQTVDAASLFTFSLIFWLLLAICAGALLSDRAPAKAPGWIGIFGMSYPLLLALIVALLPAFAINPVRADIYFQSSLANFDAAIAGDDTVFFQNAQTLFDRAKGINPREDTYPLLFAERWTQVATAAGGDVQAAAQAFSQAQVLIEQAELLDPDMPYHKVNRGHMQLLFAQLLEPGSEQQVAVANNAELAFQQAFDVVDYDPSITNELAVSKWMQGRSEEAIALLEYSRDVLDPSNATTYRLLGQVYYDVERIDEAEASFAQALEQGRMTDTDRLSITLTLGEIARERGDRPTAIRYYEEVLSAGAGDWSLLYNLGLLYRDSGRTEEARAAFTAALPAAPPDRQQVIQSALDGLPAGGATAP